jgi:hypothetical protein
VFAVPKGASAPASVKAVPGPGAFPIEYTRNQEVADRYAELEGSPEEPWPPVGTELVGYLSNVVSEPNAAEGEGSWEWTIDADFGMPKPADGGSYGGPFVTAVGTGWREVSETKPADRPLDCSEAEAPPFPGAPPIPTTTCEVDEQATLAVSDLKISPPPVPISAYPGAAASLPFSFDYASSLSPPPAFALSGSTTLGKATVSFAGSNSFEPGPLDPSTHRAAPATRTATVSIPAEAKPGTYDVTVTATHAAGGAVTQVAKLVVKKLLLKLGKAKLNKADGTATLPVTVPSAGKLTVFGRGVTVNKRELKAAKTVKVTIRAKSTAKAELLAGGRVKLKVEVRFKPRSGAALSKTRSIALQKSS